MRGAARAQLFSSATGARSGALPRRAGTQAGGTGGIKSSAAVAGTWTLAGKLRSFVAELARATRLTGRHVVDDRVAGGWQAPGLGSPETGHRRGTGAGLHGAAAVHHLATADELNRPLSKPFPLGALECYDRPLLQMQEYDLLLGKDATAEVAR
jgi:hypothetical protein